MSDVRKGAKPLKLGLLGASRIASRVLPSIRANREIEVVAVAAARPGAAEEFARTHGISRHFDSYDACLADPDLEAVYISVLNTDHAELIRKSLAAGKHVLCEKPMTLAGEDAESLFALAEKRGLILLEGFMYRFHPQLIELRRIIQAGQIGLVRSVRVHFSFLLYELDGSTRPMRASSRAGGGALHDVGCYAVDFVNWMLGVQGDLPKIVSQARVLPDDPGFDLSTSALLQYADGRSATIDCAVDAPSVNTWEVSGTSGSVAALRFDPQGSVPVPLYVVNEESEARVVSCPAIDTFAAEFRNFAKAIRGEERPHISSVESIRDAHVLELIRSRARRKG
jgi:D-xylose 1-dehydrogenase (NADP+, D-xylono-1,5-lactone-forming)